MANFIRSTRELAKRMTQAPPARAVSVQTADARSLPLEDGSVDAILTSPPYLNAIDYMRGHRLSLVWLGYTLADLRKIRSNSVGAERSSQEALSPEVTAIAHAMCDTSTMAPRQRRMIERYAFDLYQMLRQSVRVMRAKGHATYIVGNSCLYGTFILNANGVTEAARLAGLSLINTRERELPPSTRYLPITAAGALSKRIRTESVLTFAA